MTTHRCRGGREHAGSQVFELWRMVSITLTFTSCQIIQRELKTKYPITWREVTTKEGVLCLLDGIMVIEKACFHSYLT